MLNWRKLFGIRTKIEEHQHLHRIIVGDVMEEIQNILSLDWVIASDGKPYLGALTAAVRNMKITNVNLKYFGYELARTLAQHIAPPPESPPTDVSLGSKASTQVDIEGDWVRYWCAQLQIPVVYHRKLWEFAYVLQALHEHGMIHDGVRGLGFGCGTEPVPSYLAARGVATTVTDLPADRAQAAGWADTNQHTASLDAAFHPHLVDRSQFERMVSIDTVDMNAIPARLQNYDFCWSICALEHLGTVEKGLAFVENAMETLRPGGIAVHTTEFNIEPNGPTFDNWPTVLFQRQHFEALAARLAAKGHKLAPLDFTLGDKPLDRFIDLPPYTHEELPLLHGWSAETPHLKVAVDGFVATCFGLIVQKAG